MKIAFYMEDGLEQIVLTPADEYEKKMLDRVHDDSLTVEIKRGSFSDCQGGWKRHGVHYTNSTYGSSVNDESTMLVLRPKPLTPGAK